MEILRLQQQGWHMGATSLYDEEMRRAAARKAALRYVYDTEPGISRRRRGKGFQYIAPDGSSVGCEHTIGRINSLAIPPAYKKVWICADENGHLQATGRDDRNRKQYRYHPSWAEVRAISKFDKLQTFAEALPGIRKTIARDMSSSSELTEKRVLAAMVSLLDKTYMRIGSPQYAREHGTYGLTTLRRKHDHSRGGWVRLDFDGKNGTPWEVELYSPKLAKVIRQCEEIPGYRIFKYIDENGDKRVVESDDVNDYLYGITGAPITAKDFRTWAASQKLFSALRQTPVPDSKRAQQIAYNDAVREVAEELGHTPAVCKKSYLSPSLQEKWLEGSLPHKTLSSRKDQLDDEEYTFARWWAEQ